MQSRILFIQTDVLLITEIIKYNFFVIRKRTYVRILQERIISYQLKVKEY